MTEQTLEGTWEEIVARAPELRGRRLQVRVLPAAAPKSVTLSPENQRMLAWLEEWKRTPLTDEEERVLDGFEQFRKDHPIRFRTPDELE